MAAADPDESALRSRIEAARQAEAQAETKQTASLWERISSVEAADEREAALATARDAELPIVCLDAMLPGQRLELTTEDPTFCELLREIGLGGLFCMVSLDPRQRRVRRHGVIVRVALMDVARRRDGIPSGYGAPTAVRTMLVGRSRCALLEPSSRLCVGRWRREYDPEGEGAALGWGDEPLVALPEGWAAEAAQAADEAAAQAAAEAAAEAAATADSERRSGEGPAWTLQRVRLLHGEDDVLPSASTLGSGVSALAEAADAVLTALAEWEALARADSTYDNVDVVAGGRAQRGAPGLRLDPARLLDAVQEELGPRPEKPTALALWVAALINPLPSLGIAPEIRAAVLQAPGAEQRLRIVERGVRRSIANLSGKRPL